MSKWGGFIVGGGKKIFERSKRSEGFDPTSMVEIVELI